MTATTTPDEVDDLLFVWDFDWTVVNCNSDEYVPAQFHNDLTILNEEFRRRFVEETNCQDWQASVQGLIQDLLAQGRAAPEAIEQACRQMPYLVNVQETLRRIHQEQQQQHESTNQQRRIRQMILSDGNSLFIQSFLNRHNMQHYFERVVTNQAQWVVNDDDDTEPSTPQFRIIHQSQEYNGEEWSSPENCLSNLCKTQALQKTLESVVGEGGEGMQQQRPTRIVYIGDGHNDACPVLHVLQSNDVLLARTGRKNTDRANRQQGGQDDDDDDDEVVEGNDGPEKGSPFGILPALQKAERRSKNPCVPTCSVREWRTGGELRRHVEAILGQGAVETKKS